MVILVGLKFYDFLKKNFSWTIIWSINLLRFECMAQQTDESWCPTRQGFQIIKVISLVIYQGSKNWPEACQNQFWTPLILHGCSPSGLSIIRFVCVQIREIHTVRNYLQRLYIIQFDRSMIRAIQKREVGSKIDNLV